MKLRLSSFLASEDGAITVDWVVITAAIAFLGAVLVGGIAVQVTDKSTGIEGYLKAVQVGE